ncbi:MAG TPA: biotin/lipoyl-containing protein [Blastocatellia bacterium]|nr:biotin/lipoyl-containing protein [Blastocatellia bacterium]
MKVQLHLNQKSLAADFTATEGIARLTSENTQHEAEFAELQPGVFTVILQGKVFACTLEKLPSGATEVIVNGQRIAVTVQDPKRLSHNAGAAGQAGGRAVLTSPMPGKVVRVMCAAGDEVTEGQGLLVVEAMKMQNEVQAPKDGKVTDLKVTEGQTVNAGDVLAIVE